MLDKKIEIKIVSESKTFQEKRKIKIIWVLREEKLSGLMNRAIISSPSLVVPLPPPPQLLLIFTTVTEKFGMTGPCTPRVRILRRWGGGGAALGLFFSALSPEGRFWDGQREWCSQLWAHFQHYGSGC